MGFSQKFLVCLLLTGGAFSHDGAHISYLMQSKEVGAAIDLYEEYRKEIGRHDFEVLSRLGMIVLQQGVVSADPEVQLLSIFGASIAGISSSIDILEQGIKSPNGDTQLAALQFLARMQDDRCDEILTKAMSSPFLQIRMEAGFYLSERKHRKVAGQIEALMYRMPHEFWFYFPHFFALIGTSEAIGILRHLMEDPFSTVRVEAIMSAARMGRDDLLPKIRVHATHPHGDEQEACAAALGILQDSSSIPRLKKLSESPLPHVQLSALRSLYMLGDTTKLDDIIKLAREGNLFAIALLGDIPGGADALFDLLLSENTNIRINAGIALLKLRDPRSLPVIEEILIKDSRDLGFQPQISVGHSLSCWKVIPSLQQNMKNAWVDLYAISLGLREQLLIQCLELPQNAFLHIAHRLFDTNQTDLIPLLAATLENHRTEPAVALLKRKAQQAGSPYIRAYCNLALYRMNEKGPYEQYLRDQIAQAKTHEMIRFRPNLSYDKRAKPTPYELTPEESSRLLIESYQALASRHDEQGIERLLEAIKDGNPKNRYALAGLLIHAIQ